MKKLSPLAQYIVERSAINPSAPEGMETGAGEIIGLGKDQQIFTNVVTKNPKGKAFSSSNSGFGFGMGMDTPTAAFVQDFMVSNAAEEDRFSKDPETGEEKERFADTDEPELPNWQQVNRAVGNYVRNKIDASLTPMKLGRVAKNPTSRYDGMDTSKIGVILDKKFNRSKIKFRTF